MTGYAQPLRAIGQALEVLKIQDFEIEPENGCYYVRGNVFAAAGKSGPGRGTGSEHLRVIWGSGGENGQSKQARARNDRNDSTASVSAVELYYTAQDIERLEQEGRARRGLGGEAAEAYSVSQILRSIGAYLNQKRARLYKLRRETDRIVVEYDTTIGSRMKETLAIKDLYDLWVRMYLQRAERAH